MPDNKMNKNCPLICCHAATIPSFLRIFNAVKLKDLMAEIEIRSSHDELTPTLGGVAIFAATLISYFLWKIPSEGNEMHLAVTSLIILFFLGIKDDILILSPKKKILIQIPRRFYQFIYMENVVKWILFYHFLKNTI